MEQKHPESTETETTLTKNVEHHEGQDKPHIVTEIDTSNRIPTKHGSNKYGGGPDKPGTGDARSNSEWKPRNSQHGTYPPHKKFTSNKINNIKSEHDAPKVQPGHNKNFTNEISEKGGKEWKKQKRQ